MLNYAPSLSGVRISDINKHKKKKKEEEEEKEEKVRKPERERERELWPASLRTLP